MSLSSSWTLYEHPPGTKDWSLESYRKIATFTTAKEIIAMMRHITDKEDRVTGAYLCLMRDDLKPIYEAEENRKGGALTVRFNADKSTDFWKFIIAHVVTDDILVPGAETEIIHGVIISPKKGNIIIQLWTREEIGVCDLNPVVALPIPGEILYRPHYERI
jgi:translation initiation factor 4E